MDKRDFAKEFEKVFLQLAQRYSRWEVWNDFLYMAAAALARTVPSEKREEREKQYLERIGKYKSEEQELFPQLLSLVVMALEDQPEQDFLGSMYHRLELHQKQKGQFFTPYHISEFMAEIQFPDKEVGIAEEMEKKGYISVADCCCGAGAMLVAFANVARKHGLDYQHNVLFYAQDIDRTAALMCYIQLSLLGCPAVVVIGDSLVKPGFHPDNDVWYTLFYYLNWWKFKDSKEESPEQAMEERIREQATVVLSEDTDGQMSLFLGGAA